MANGDTVQSYGAVRNPLVAGQQQIALNEKGEQLMSSGLPAATEMTRKGQAWGCMSTAAVAGLVVRPSTTAALELFNGYPTGQKSLIVDRAFFFNLVSTNVIEGFSGWLMVTKAKAAPSTASLAVSSLQGNKAYGGPVINAVSTTVVDNGWFPWTQAYNKGAGGVVPFGAVIGDVSGRLIVPPQCSLCLHVVSSLVGQTFTQGAFWYEEQITLE